MTTSKKQDTFLIGHARRMREYRKRQVQANLEGYRNRLKYEKRRYRSRLRSEMASNGNVKNRKQLNDIARVLHKERQARYRLNWSDEKRKEQREKDRNYRRMKRKQKREQLKECSDNFRTSLTVKYSSDVSAKDSDDSIGYFYRFELKRSE